jgi:hypothetical protein
MKARIIVTGQFRSITQIARHFHEYNTCKGLPFNEMIFHYDTIAKAVKDMRWAWARIKEEDDNINEDDRLTDKGKYLRYDSGVAEVSRDED